MPFPPKTPYLAVDALVNVQNEAGEFLGIVLIERKYPPVGLALPGGFVEVGETVERAVIREMKEELTLDVIPIRQFKVYSDPNRDPRGIHVVSVVFECVARGEPVGSDDAKKARIFHYDAMPLERLVFDHSKIVRDYLNDPEAVFKKL
ncbi:NUDIX domain-containing protein [Thermovibrio ammonificans]